LRSYGNRGRDRQRNRGFFSGMIRGVSNPRDGCGPKLLLGPTQANASGRRDDIELHPPCPNAKRTQTRISSAVVSTVKTVV
jgi:hypothetical protein